MSNSLIIMRYRKKLKKWALSCFDSHCGICNYNKCERALEFHHINPNEKDFGLSTKTYSLTKIKNELKKCVCLCSNCHREVHDNITIIPNNIKRFKEIAFKNKKEINIKYCKICSIQINTELTFCSYQCARKSREKIIWPNKDELEKLVWSKPRTVLSIQLGVSDKAIAKRCSILGIEQPNRGYWQKKKLQSF